MPLASTVEFAAGSQWREWKWQQRSAIRTADGLREVFPAMDSSDLEAIERHSQTMRFQVTPYYLGLVRTCEGGDAPLLHDPLWQQVRPSGDTTPENDLASYVYDGTENWELPSEMVTPIAQHKYDDRIIVRLSNVCHAYCQFCYEALRTLEKKSEKESYSESAWAETLKYLERNPQLEEVILSGGEPLMHDDAQLARMLQELKALKTSPIIRIHTRALTFNPFRVTDELVDILADAGVTAIGLHVSHAHEVSQEFESAVRKLQRAVPVIFANIPLLRGINATADDIRQLSMSLYRCGVARGYLYHFMPHSPASDRFRTSVQDGVDIIRALKRRVSNLAVPEFVLPHHTGKHTMPLLYAGEPSPTRTTSADGNSVVRYTSWTGEVVEYPDPPLPGVG